MSRSAREFEAAATYLSRQRSRASAALVLAIACAVLTAAAPEVHPAATVPCGTGALAGLVLAALSWTARRERIARLALEPSAYVLPEVAAYGRRFLVAAERANLAASLEDIVLNPAGAGQWCLGERVSTYGAQLAGLARALRQPHVEVRPESMVACHRLLTAAAESPLYNPRISADELPAAIRRIWTGIAYRPDEASG